MSGFTAVASITNISEKEYAELQKHWGHRLSLKAMWSWNGEYVCVEDFDEIERISEDEELGYKKLMESNRRD